MREVTVALGERSYEVVIGEGALPASAERLRAVVGKGQAAIVADETVWKLHADTLRAVLPDAPVVTVPSGEASKSWSEFERVTEALLAAGVGRDGTVVAFGGGVTGDLAGFCAATLRRGCRFVQVPTTLLAMVDSSVGGKTAINTAAGKNLVGAFHQPSLVVADMAFLTTLREREFKTGMAEVLKAAFIDGPAAHRRVLDWLTQAFSTDGPGQGHAPEDLATLVENSVALKADIVSRDEREGGVRALLNLGHTFGHAVEAAYGYDGRVLHGEAVGLGMAMAMRFAMAQGFYDGDDVGLIEGAVVAAGLPMWLGQLPDPETVTASGLLSAMEQDKKVEAGKITLVLPRRIGQVEVVKDVPRENLFRFLRGEVSEVHKS